MNIQMDMSEITDEEVVKRVLAGEVALFEILMRRYNQRLYRVARSIVGDASEAEDVMQDAYVQAYTHLSQFAGLAKFSTWLTKIAVNEALARVRKRRQFVDMVSTSSSGEEKMSALEAKSQDPEQSALTRELNAVLEAAVGSLPDAYRSVFMLRNIEGMSTAETAECLDISEENVKIRLYRARYLLKEEINSYVGTAAQDAFQFAGRRCDRVVSAVLHIITKNNSFKADSRA
ncbi:MAG: RNA polymerase sigma factor [Deltaproteobacteria bacterium]